MGNRCEAQRHPEVPSTGTYEAISLPPTQPLDAAEHQPQHNNSCATPPYPSTQTDEEDPSNDDDPLPFHPGQMKTLGKGGFGTTYLVRCYTTNTDMVAKVMTPNDEYDDATWEVFEDELEFYDKMERTGGRKWMPRFYGSGTMDKYKRPWILIELFDDCVHNLVYNGQAAPLFRHLALGMLGALEGLHAEGYIHRDVKPENFVVKWDTGASGSSRPRVCLIDFGLVMEYPAAIDEDEDFLCYTGTFKYSSERHLQQRVLGTADDLESLGYTLFEMYTGRCWDHYKLPEEPIAPKSSDEDKENIPPNQAANDNKLKRCREPTREPHHQQGNGNATPNPARPQHPSQEEARKGTFSVSMLPDLSPLAHSCDVPRTKPAIMTMGERCDYTLENRKEKWAKLTEHGIIPQFLHDWMNYCKSLSALECPNYYFLRTLLQNAPEMAPSSVKSSVTLQRRVRQREA